MLDYFNVFKLVFKFMKKYMRSDICTVPFILPVTEGKATLISTDHSIAIFVK